MAKLSILIFLTMLTVGKLDKENLTLKDKYNEPDCNSNDKICDKINQNDTCLEEDETISLILKSLMQNYRKDSVPSKLGVVTSLELHINDIPSLSELQSEFSLDLMYSEVWRDERLSFKTKHQGHCIQNMTMDLDFLNKLWTPNTCIVNSKSAVIHASPSLNVFLILYDDGTIWKNCRMMVRAPCEIDLRSFPFDHQTCHMTFESYSFNSQKVRLEWFKDHPVTFVKSIELPDFKLVDWKAEHFVQDYPNGQWEQLKASFVFKRRYGFFILQAYVPTYMTIFVAWINFWMDSKELSTRGTLAISAFLAITLQFGNILKNQPPVSYVKALDVWMLGCIIFLFTSLAELAVVSFMQRTDKPGYRANHSNLVNNNDELNCVELIGRTSFAIPPSNKKYTITPYSVDKFCLIMYPPAFIAFNIFYWCFFVGLENL